MRNSYKDQYNEWAYEFYEQTGRDPSVKESDGFHGSWLEDKCELADNLRKGEVKWLEYVRVV